MASKPIDPASFSGGEWPEAEHPERLGPPSRRPGYRSPKQKRITQIVQLLSPRLRLVQLRLPFDDEVTAG
jgi:hypothetical protein